MDQSFLKVGGHYYEYSMAVCQGALGVGLDPVLFVNRRLPMDTAHHLTMASGVPVHPWFVHAWDQGHGLGIEQREPGHFGFEVFQALDTHRATEQDMVLIHTLGWHQLSQILDMCMRLPRWRLLSLPVFAFILRYEPRELSQIARDALRDRFTRAQATGLRRSRILFFTDTDPLTRLYTGLFQADFTTAPIPVNH